MRKRIDIESCRHYKPATFERNGHLYVQSGMRVTRIF